MKDIVKLELGLRDAEGYKVKENKDLFNHIFKNVFAGFTSQ